MKRAREMMARAIASGDRAGTDAEYAEDIADEIRAQQLAAMQAAVRWCVQSFGRADVEVIDPAELLRQAAVHLECLLDEDTP